MSSLYSLLIDKLKMFLFPYGTLTQSEIRASGGESFLPTDLRVSWIDLFGTPYYQTIPTGGETLATSGIADIAGNNKLRVQTILGFQSGASGNVVIKFSVGSDPENLGIHELDSSLNITVAAVSATVVETYTTLTVGSWRYIKVYSITHSVGSDVTVQVKIFNAGRAIVL